MSRCPVCNAAAFALMDPKERVRGHVPDQVPYLWAAPRLRDGRHCQLFPNSCAIPIFAS
jgi:hypothetical protein